MAAEPPEYPAPEEPAPAEPVPNEPAPNEPAPSSEPEPPITTPAPKPHRARALLTRAAVHWPYALIALLYLATSPYHQGLNNPNEMVRVYMTKALAEEGTMAIDKVVREWGGVDDKAIREGKLYSSKAPLQSLVGVPAYKAARPIFSFLGITPTKRALTTFLRLFGAVLPGFIFASILLSWARKRAFQLGAPLSLGTAVGLSIALGTMLYPYAITFTGHILAALAAGGCYLAVAAMSRREPMTPRWRRLVLLAGAGAGAAPFAEYPAALVALPALIAAVVMTKTARARAEVLLLATAGGAAPFVLGLWAHHASWGSPFRTGYTFLENRAYSELHGAGFFGVGAPKFEAIAGALFSPGTGLFFFSPILIVGLATLVTRCFKKPNPDQRGLDAPLGRAVAIAGLVGFILEVLFIGGHRGWRGGWTLGPRYIIAVAPLLSVWVIEAMDNPRMRSFIASFGAVSIVTTGFAAALYPHLSDVYTNPLRTFVVPSYLHGEASYGIAWWIGLEGTAANLFHLVPLLFAVGWVALAGAREEGGLKKRIAISAVTFVSILGIVAVIPERDSAAAQHENQRLWGFWEPIPRAGRPPIARPEQPPPIIRPPGMMWEARSRWREVRVEQVSPDGKVRPCALEEARKCRYGNEPWQYIAPELLEIGGTNVPLLFMHPISGATVRATFVPPIGARRAILRYGLTDASTVSENTDPVRIRVTQGRAVLGEVKLGNERGLHALDFSLTSSAAIALELGCGRDGARVFGFDLEMYRL